jgi:peptidylprolyl isomerase
MLKNITPLLIVLIVISVGIGGIFFLSNSTPSSPAQLDTNQVLLPTSVPSSVIITPQPENNTSTEGAVMDNYTTTADGLKYMEIVEGSGQEVKTGDTVTVHYLGTLQNGTKFDSSYDRNVPFTTQIGVGQVIKGWDEGIVGMKVGGKRKLIIPADLGYGQQGAGSIPPNSVLIFEVQLLSVK